MEWLLKEPFVSFSDSIKKSVAVHCLRILTKAVLSSHEVFRPRQTGAGCFCQLLQQHLLDDHRDWFYRFYSDSSLPQSPGLDRKRAVVVVFAAEHESPIKSF